MIKQLNKIAVLTSGGDAPGMNAAIRAVVRAAVYHNVGVMGIQYGYQGMIEDDFIPLDARSVKNIINRGGTFLKSFRSRDFREREGREKAYENLRKHKVEGLVIIGGDGSLTGANIFEREFGFPCIGIPGTIDNDIYGTNYTIGFDTAVNTAIDAIDKIRDTASSHNRLFFVEVMGRDAGFIATYSGIAGGAEAILVPETHLGVDYLLEKLTRSRQNKKSSSIVIVAEGDQLGGAYEVARKVGNRLPGYEIKVTVLGHIQRGGSPTYFDRVLASRMGVEAAEALIAGKSNVMVGVENNRMIHTPMEKAVKLNPELNRELLRIAEICSI